MMDLHNHSVWSDGMDNPKQIIEHAVSNNIDIIGITDHYEIVSIMPAAGGLDGYIKEINRLKVEYPIKVLTGLEISVFTIMYGLDFRIIDMLNKLDYLLIEDFDYFRADDSFEKLKQMLKKFSCLKGLAHTDLEEMASKVSESDGLPFLLEFMQECGLFWEFNTSP